METIVELGIAAFTTLLYLGGMVVVSGGMAAGVILFFKLVQEQRSKALKAWAEVAKARGWAPHPDESGAYLVRGVGPHGMVIRLIRRGSDSFTEAWVADVAPPGATIRREPAFRIGVSETTAGAPAFDRAALVQVSDAQLGHFGGAFQQAFLSALDARLQPRVEDGGVRVQVRGLTTRGSVLESLADHAEELVRSLRPGPDLEALQAAVLEDPDAGYRARCLEVLGTLDHDQQRALAQRVLTCGEPVVEVEAALLLGDLAALRRNVDASLVPSRRLQLVGTLAAQGDGDDVWRALVSLATLRWSGGTRDLLGSVRPRKGTARGLLGLWAAWSEDGSGALPADAAVALCAALGRHEPGTPGVEEVLLSALAESEHEPEVRVAAAKALRSVGTVAVVPDLSAAAEEGGLLDRHGLEAACRQAISAIQARAAGTPGSLSLSEGQGGAGQLSEVRTPRRGGLSEPGGE